MTPVSRLLVGLVTALLWVGVAATVPVAPAGADDSRPDPPRGPAPVSAAVSVSVGDARAALAGSSGRDATMALTGLRLAYPRLPAGDRAAADSLLARPTDGPADPEQFGYTVAEAAPVCGAHFCVHYVLTSADAPAPTDADGDGVPDWVGTTLAELEAVFAFESGTLGYRPPPTDGIRGGNALFDVYLSQIGDDGLYGFCAPEDKAPGERFVYSGYCVLDNDFAEFPLGPAASLGVTAAHEFFHAIQFGYDAGEDRWLLEATATWMEERYADAIDDNRQYLPFGQLGRPRTPLDEFEPASGSQYGNWLFFELISQKYGVDAVRGIWNAADAAGNAADRYSTEAVDKIVQAHGRTFADFYARFATANQEPSAFYSEGAAYRRAPVVRETKLSPQRPEARATTRLDHLTSAAYRFVPAGRVGNQWRLRLQVDAPPTTAGSAATALVRKRNGGLAVRTIGLHPDGGRAITLDFAHARIASVTLVLVNGSTRFGPCWRGTSYSCQGIPRDDRDDYSFTAGISR